MGLEASFCGPALLNVPEFCQAHCIATLVVTLFIKHHKLTDFLDAVKSGYASHQILQLVFMTDSLQGKEI